MRLSFFLVSWFAGEARVIVERFFHHGDAEGCAIRGRGEVSEERIWGSGGEEMERARRMGPANCAGGEDFFRGSDRGRGGSRVEY
jgi:hypothetical protein